MQILILILLFAGTAQCQMANAWNGLTPLKSTKNDAERLLGDPVKGSTASHAGIYKTGSGRVFILYSTGLCEQNPEHGWNVPEFSIIRIDFEPDYPNRYKFSALKLDMSKFERRPDPGSLHLVFYTNDTDGVMLTVDTSDDTVRSFGYFPESRYRHLMCENLKGTQSNAMVPQLGQ